MSKKETSWGNVAEWYDDLLQYGDDSYQKNVIMPNLIRILGPKKDMTVLDVACGQGYFTRAFAQNGAKAVGCDISKELIELAKKNSNVKDNPAEYFVASADSFQASLGSLAGPIGRFHAVTIVLALQNIENLSGVFAECAKVLKSGGRLIFVLNHPAFRIPGYTNWHWDEKEQKLYRTVESYMSRIESEIDMTPGEKDIKKKKKTISFHHPLQTYFKALNKNGFAVTRLEEWISHKKSQKGPRQSAEDKARHEIPMFVCVEAMKL